MIECLEGAKGELTADAMGRCENVAWSNEGTCARSDVAGKPADNIVGESSVLVQISGIWATVWIILTRSAGVKSPRGVGERKTLVAAQYGRDGDSLWWFDLNVSRAGNTWWGRLMDIGSAWRRDFNGSWCYRGGGGCWRMAWDREKEG